MAPPTSTRGVAAAAGAGGACLVVYALAVNTTPVGCIADACATSPQGYRQNPVWMDVVGALGLLLIAGAAMGLVRLAALSRPAGRWWTLLPGVLIILGVVLIIAGIAAGSISEDLPPLGVVSGMACLLVGGVLAAVVVLRSRILPRYVAVALAVGTLALVAFNDQNWRVLMCLPFALAWILTGLALVRSPARAATPRLGTP